jgi:uncharacterized protein YciI
MHYILFYELVEDYVTRRALYRRDHLKNVQEAHERGELVLAGALADPVNGAVLIFNGPDSTAAERFVETDPYVKNGLVTSWRIRKWSTVVGKGSTPLSVADAGDDPTST